MTAHLVLVGLDHHTAPIEVRERLAVAPEHTARLLRRVVEDTGVEEALLLSTCNRTEAYAVAAGRPAAERVLDAVTASLADAPDPASGIYLERTGEDAALHLFRVTAGLESAILGETEIQGQVRRAQALAREAGTLGRVLDRLARGALHAGKRARSQTTIAAGGVSHGSAAAAVVRRVFGDLRGRSVLVVGAGTMATQTARALEPLGPAQTIVANRTIERAAVLAEALPAAQASALDAIPRHLADAHVVVLAGGATPLAREAVQAALARRRDPLVLIDLGLPRLVDPAVAGLPGVFLYDLDALEELVQGAVATRRDAIPHAERIVVEEFSAFRSWHRTLDALPAIHSLHSWAEALRMSELAHLPPDLPPAAREAFERLSERLVQKLLGRPASRVVKGMEEEDPSMPTPEHLRSVFGLEEGES